ncbi:hypothetical protein BTM25_03020 [Actinomadura rubteroloni]|uniref:Uncharacterized protein n=1 Tax=Actinomadura rubteroloni TaxID=1926885 RepID=A0A2P4ULJ0_9ACTN|nr:DUF6585 family protein [Actinomadura rubteroloni]POM25918.1 hypothetical protein BTM25_03020 [Actinomadura rubteroloni]
MAGHIAGELAPQMDMMAERAGLGARRGVYAGAQPDGGSIRFSLVAAVVCAVLAVVLFAAGTAFGMFFVLFAVIAVCLWIAELSTAAKNTRLGMHLYERGLVATVKGRTHAVRYDRTEVFQSSIRQTGVGGYTDYSYKLTDVEGVQFTLQGRNGGTPATGKFARHDEWGTALQEGVTRAQLPSIVERLNAGQRVDFGKLWVTRDEVGSAKGVTRWHEIEDLRIIQGFLKLKVAGKWRSAVNVAVSSIPNLYVFIGVADQLRGRVR